MTPFLCQEYPPATKGKVVVWGLLGSRPFGGIIWQVLHHLVGLRRLGFDVWYVEDCLDWLIEPEGFDWTDDHARSADHLARIMSSIGLSDRWFFRPPEPRDALYGGSERSLRTLYGDAELLLNLCGSHTVTGDEGADGPIVYVQTDPVTDQMRAAAGDPVVTKQFSRHDRFFSYGENLGTGDSSVPLGDVKWRTTRAPVCIDWWATDDPPEGASAVTTIASWHQSHKDLEWQGDWYYWDKKREFLKFADLPGRTDLVLELALTNIEDEDVAMMQAKGWRILDSKTVASPEAYRRYIRGSFAEFTVAKDQNVRLRSGWFSDRSACYLAAGRPVVMQDTGFGRALPTGEGLFAVGTQDEAADALERIRSGYERQSAAAREIAAEYFDASKVLPDLLEEVGSKGAEAV